MSLLFFFNDTATTEIYTLSLHDALPIFLLYYALSDAPEIMDRKRAWVERVGWECAGSDVPFFLEIVPYQAGVEDQSRELDRKSTRLNSSHGYISDAVFCLEKKNSNPCP